MAFPGAIYFVENRGDLTDIRDSTRFDIITRRMAHEVSHQWWGHQLSPSDVEGATMLVETLAKYSEQLVLRDRRGAPALEPLLQVDEDRYRQGAAEDVDEEPVSIGWPTRTTSTTARAAWSCTSWRTRWDRRRSPVRSGRYSR